MIRQGPPIFEGDNATDLRGVFGFPQVRASAPAFRERAFGPFPRENSELSDPDIRLALGKAFATWDLVLEEVECWRGHVRADYICMSSNALSVVEIKSDFDSLRRFDEQVRIYSAVADRVTLVVGWSLAVQALRAVPGWWDVLLAERDPTFGIRIVPLRDGVQNPDGTADALVAMLPIDDVRRLACAADTSLGRLRGRALRKAVANRLSRAQLRVAIGEWLARLSRQRSGSLGNKASNEQDNIRNADGEAVNRAIAEGRA
jgi:hypothetical protein